MNRRRPTHSAARAMTNPKTRRAPACRSVRAHSFSVAPLVYTSSTSRRIFPRTASSEVTAKLPAMLCARSRASMPARRGSVSTIRRSTSSLKGRARTRATSRASSVAWLYPRSRSRRGWRGTGSTTSTSRKTGSSRSTSRIRSRRRSHTCGFLFKKRRCSRRAPRYGPTYRRRSSTISEQAGHCAGASRALTGM